MKCVLIAENYTIPPALAHLEKVESVQGNFDVYVILNAEGTSLLIPTIAKKTYRIDFESEAMNYRSAESRSHQELVVRACRIKNLNRPCSNSRDYPDNLKNQQ